MRHHFFFLVGPTLFDLGQSLPVAWQKQKHLEGKIIKKHVCIVCYCFVKRKNEDLTVTHVQSVKNIRGVTNVLRLEAKMTAHGSQTYFCRFSAILTKLC